MAPSIHIHFHKVKGQKHTVPTLPRMGKYHARRDYALSDRDSPRQRMLQGSVPVSAMMSRSVVAIKLLRLEFSHEGPLGVDKVTESRLRTVRKLRRPGTHERENLISVLRELRRADAVD